MTTKLNRQAYADIVAENLEWLNKQPHSLERDHLRVIAEHSVRHEYGECERELRALREVAEAARVPMKYRPGTMHHRAAEENLCDKLNALDALKCERDG